MIHPGLGPLHWLRLHRAGPIFRSSHTLAITPRLPVDHGALLVLGRGQRRLIVPGQVEVLCACAASRLVAGPIHPVGPGGAEPELGVCRPWRRPVTFGPAGQAARRRLHLVDVAEGRVIAGQGGLKARDGPRPAPTLDLAVPAELAPEGPCGHEADAHRLVRAKQAPHVEHWGSDVGGLTFRAPSSAVGHEGLAELLVVHPPDVCDFEGPDGGEVVLGVPLLKAVQEDGRRGRGPSWCDGRRGARRVEDGLQPLEQRLAGQPVEVLRRDPGPCTTLGPAGLSLGQGRALGCNRATVGPSPLVPGPGLIPLADDGPLAGAAGTVEARLDDTAADASVVIPLQGERVRRLPPGGAAVRTVGHGCKGGPCAARAHPVAPFGPAERVDRRIPFPLTEVIEAPEDRLRDVPEALGGGALLLSVLRVRAWAFARAAWLCRRGRVPRTPCGPGGRCRGGLSLKRRGLPCGGPWVPLLLAGAPGPVRHRRVLQADVLKAAPAHLGGLRLLPPEPLGRGQPICRRGSGFPSRPHRGVKNRHSQARALFHAGPKKLWGPLRGQFPSRAGRRAASSRLGAGLAELRSLPLM